MAWAVVRVMIQPWPMVAAPVAAGATALQIKPLGAITSILFRIPWFQGMPEPSRGATPPNTAPTRQPSVQLIYPDACGDESDMSMVNLSPSLIILTSVR